MNSGAIVGVVGAGDAGLAERMCACLTHRGSFRDMRASSPSAFVARHVDGCESGWDSHCVLSCGEIKNRAALLTLLDIDESRQTRFSDAELLLRLYLGGGVAGLAYVRGSFEVAIYDCQLGELVLASGFDSVRSLYVASVGAGWAFSPEIKAFLSLPGIALNEVRRLWPGHYVRLGQTEGAEAEMPPGDVSATPATFPELRRTVVVAARTMCEDAERIAVVLTPDCGALLALAAVCWVSPDRPIDTYVVGLGEKDPFLDSARRIADRFQTRHREISVSSDTIDSLLPELVWHIEEPRAPCQMLEYLLAAYQAVSDGARLICGISAPAPTQSGWPGGLRVPRRSHQPIDAAGGEGQLIVPCRRDLAALEQIHARAGLAFAPLFNDASVRLCSERLQLRHLAHRKHWWRAMSELSAGLVPPELYRETLSIGRSRDVLRGRQPEMHRLWSKAFLGQEDPSCASITSIAYRRAHWAAL